MPANDPAAATKVVSLFLSQLHVKWGYPSLNFTEVSNQITKLHPDFLTGPSLNGATDACDPGLSTIELPQADLCFQSVGQTLCFQIKHAIANKLFIIY